MQAETARMSMDKTSMYEGDSLGVTQDPPTSSAQDVSISLELDVGVADDARSSTSSDKSESKQPRSAMRRSSSNPKIPQSPRRVRFDFMGEEVLPTSSPQPTAFMSARMSSPEPADGEGNWASHLGTEPGEDEDGSAPPRKVSSSDALRALSRVPLEDGTVWTVVNSDSEDAAPDQSQPASHPIEDLPGTNNALTTGKSATLATIAHDKHPSKSTVVQSGQNLHSNDEVSSKSYHSDDESSDDDVLAMAKPKPSPSSISRTTALLYPPGTKEQGATMPFDGQHNSDSPKVVDIKKASQSNAAAQDEEGIFRFEGDGSQLPETPPASHNSTEDQISEDEHSDHEDSSVQPAPMSIYATSPAISIVKRRDTNAEDTTPGRPKPQPEQTMIGSYKGRPLIVSIMRNPDLLAQLESAEKVDEVLGSFHDRKSTPPKDPGPDFEAALSAARSFSERATIEDMMEAAKSRQRSTKVRQS